MSDVDIVLEVATKGVENIYNLSGAMKQLNLAINQVANPIKNLDARSRALSAAVGATDSSLKAHAKTLSALTQNQVILSNELGRVRKEIAGVGSSFKVATGDTARFAAAGVRDLQNYEKALKSIKFGALIEDLKSVAQEQKRLGKDAQFVGRSLIIGLTTPIMGFARYGLQALVGLDREFVRLNKVLESIAPNLDSAAQKMGVDLKGATDAQIQSLQKLVDNYTKLEASLSGISMRFGTSKELVVSLAGEFAELGIQSTEAIATITELTTATEKLGNMDIGSARQLVQSLYFQAVRAMQQSGESLNMSAIERETAAIAAAKSQLAMFNAVENTTALTLKDLGKAFPEVAAAATTFGLSMTEAAAILAPMKAAGMEVGASANAIKISLQSMVTPTKKTETMFSSLTDEYGDHFKMIKGTGLDAVQSLIGAYQILTRTGAKAGQEGALQFFSQVFGKRQGTRMLTGVQQLADMDSVLKDTTVSANRAEKQIQAIANAAITSANKATGANLPLVDSYKSMGILARVATATAGQAVDGFTKKVSQSQIDAAIKVRNDISKGILDKTQQDGTDLIGSVATEAGRAMFVQLAGVKNAQEVADRELENSLQSLEVTIQRLKNGFKMFATDLIKTLRPTFEKVTKMVIDLYEAWKRLDPATKELIAKLTIGFAAVTAAIGPLIFMFGQFRLAMGSVSKVLFGFLPGLKTMTVEMVAAKGAMLNLTKPLTVMGDTVVNTNGKFATFIATIASGDGPLANFAKKIGQVTGVLQKQTTAPIALTRSVTAIQNARLSPLAGDGLFEAVTGTPAAAAPSLSARLKSALRLQRTGVMSGAAGVRGPGGRMLPMDPDQRDVLRKVEEMMKQALVGKGYPTMPGGRGPGGLFARTVDDLVQEAIRLQSGGVTSGAIGIRGPGGRFRAPTAAQKDALKTYEEIRETLLKRSVAQRALSRKDIGFDIFTDQRTYKGRDISAERASDIYRGGIKGAIARTSEAMARSREAAPARMAAIGTKAKEFATAPVDMYNKSIQGAKNSLLALRSQHAAAGVEAPRFFAKMSAAVKGFVSSTALATNAIKIMKMTLIASGIGAVILAIGVAIMLIKRNMDQFKEAGKSGLKTVKEAFGIVKNAALELIRPILDLFASFGSGAEGAGGAVSGLGGLFNALAGALKFVAQIFSWLVTTIIQPYLYIVMNLVKFVINLFQGKWMDALKALGAAFGGAFALIGKIVLNIMGFIVKQVINLIFELPSAFVRAWAWGIEKATDLFFGFADFLIGQVKRIPVLGKFLGGATSGAVNMLKTARDAYVGTVRTVAGAINSAGNSAGDFLKRGVDKGVKTATDAIDKLGKGGVKQSKGKVDLGKKTSPVELDVDTDPAQEKIAQSVGDGVEYGAEEGGKALARLAKELKTEIQNDIMDRIKTTMSDVVTSITDSLKNQKENSLKIYDDQLKKIDETAKAEERLTKTKEYENRKRELEEKRALDRLNNQRNYNLAIYEGRIDDARTIALEGNKAELDAQKEMTDIETSRKKELADQRKEDLISSIKDARDIASKYYDDMIESFTKAAKKITEFPPTTAEEFNTQLNSLADKAKEIAGNIGSKTSEGFTGALANLGVDSSGPLTSAMEAISKTLTENNPFGENGVWQKTIDASILGLKNKYIGLTNTLNTAVGQSSEQFKELFNIYKNYKDLVAKNEAEGSGTTGGGTTGTSGGGNRGGTSGFTNFQDIDIDKVVAFKNQYMQKKYGKDAVTRQIMSTISGTVGSVVSSGLILGSYGAGQKDFMAVINSSRYRDAILTDSRIIYDDILKNKGFFMKGATGLPSGKLITTPSLMIGGVMPYGQGGPTKGPVQQGIPAILHGGEYVVRNSAVKKYGWGMMQQINQGTYKPKPFAVGGMIDRRRAVSDRALPEFAWQQANGGFTEKYWDRVGSWETGGGKTPNLKHSNKKFAGAYGLTKANWLDYGGLDFATSADKASKIQQLVIANRKAAFGYVNKIMPNPSMPSGAIQLMYPTGTGGWTTIGKFGKVDEPFNIKDSFASAEARKMYLDKRSKNYFRGTGTAGTSGYRPPHERAIQMYGYNPLVVPRSKSIANQEFIPLSDLNSLISSGQYPSLAKGGIVDESRNNISGLRNLATNKKKKKGLMGGALDAIKSGAGFAGNLLYSGIESLMASTTNPLGKALRLPGFENARVAGLGESAVNAAFLAADIASLGGAEIYKPLVLASMGIRKAERDAIMMAPKTNLGRIISREQSLAMVEARRASRTPKPLLSPAKIAGLTRDPNYFALMSGDTSKISELINNTMPNANVRFDFELFRKLPTNLMPEQIGYDLKYDTLDDFFFAQDHKLMIPVSMSGAVRPYQMPNYGMGLAFDVDGLYSSLGSASDVIKLIAYVYDNLIKPYNITSIYSTNVSKYSSKMLDTFAELMPSLDTNISVLKQPIGNQIDFYKTRGGLPIHSTRGFNAGQKGTLTADEAFNILSGKTTKAEFDYVTGYNYGQYAKMINMARTPSQRIQNAETIAKIINAKKQARIQKKFIGGLIEYAKGGIVDESRNNVVGLKNVKLPKKKKGGVFGILNAVQSGVSKAMGTTANFMDYAYNQLIGVPMESLQASTFNPLMKALKVPGSENLRVAGTAETGLNAAFTALDLATAKTMTGPLTSLKGSALDLITGITKNKLGKKATARFGVKTTLQEGIKMAESAGVFNLNPFGTRRIVPRKEDLPTVPKNPLAVELFRKPLVPEQMRWDIEQKMYPGSELRTSFLTTDTYDIAGSKVAFGVDEPFRLSNPTIKTFNRNPYEIANVDPLSESGYKLASDYFYATAANNRQSGPITYVDALLYAMSKGDVKARAEFYKLAALGIQEKEIGLQRRHAGKLHDYIKKEIIKRGLNQITAKDLFVTHETAYKPFSLPSGELGIFPTSKFRTTYIEEPRTYEELFHIFGGMQGDEELVNKIIKDKYIKLGRLYYEKTNPNDTVDYSRYWRDTIHMALNHTVMGHGQRPSIQNGYTIVGNLQRLLERNPGSLSSLYAVDTWFAPKPGQPLVFPRGSFEVFEGGFQERYDAVNNYIRDQFGQIKNIYKPENPSEYVREYIDPIIPGGDHGTSDNAWAGRLYQIAESLGVQSNKHFESASMTMAGMRNMQREFGPGDWQTLSPNEIASLFFNRNPFTGIKRGNTVEYIRAPRSFIGGLIPKPFANGGIVPNFDSMAVPAILHGGEYVVNSKAVKNIGFAALEAMNNMRFQTPKTPAYAGAVSGQATSSSTVHIYVDNFIGEKAWFESMMKDYNINVGPQNQKAAGLQNRTITTYNGINRGL
jgi:hypothetical protein